MVNVYLIASACSLASKFVPDQKYGLVRSEEGGGSNPLSSTRFQRAYTIFDNRVVLVLSANERAGTTK